VHLLLSISVFTPRCGYGFGVTCPNQWTPFHTSEIASSLFAWLGVNA
jgi:hypothetical protein